MIAESTKIHLKYQIKITNRREYMIDALKMRKRERLIHKISQLSSKHSSKYKKLESSLIVTLKRGNRITAIRKSL